MRTSELLRKSYDLIDTPAKWWQAGNGNPNGTCPLLAPGDAFYGRECAPAASALAPVAIEAQESVARAAGLSDARDIPAWNDAPERTHVEVMVAFAEAIANAEAAEQEFSPSACEPVTFDSMPMDLVRKALDSAPFTAEEHAAWVRAWEGI